MINVTVKQTYNDEIETHDACQLKVETRHKNLVLESRGKNKIEAVHNIIARIDALRNSLAEAEKVLMNL